MESEPDFSDSDADPKHSKDFNATFAAEHMPTKAYPSPSVDPGEYSLGSNAETRKAEAQKFFNEAQAKDRYSIVSPQFDSS